MTDREIFDYQAGGAARIKGAPREIAAVDGKNPDENVNYEHYGAEFAKKFNGNPVWNLYVSQSRAALTAVAPLIEREVLERAAQEMRPMLRSMISRNEAANAIRAMKEKT